MTYENNFCAAHQLKNLLRMFGPACFVAIYSGEKIEEGTAPDKIAFCIRW